MGPTLVTGAAGMVGTYLCRGLAAEGAAVLATDLRPGRDVEALDVRDGDAVRALVAARLPGVVHHLAAQSLPVSSLNDPAHTLIVNVLGTAHLFEAIRAARRAHPNYDPMVVVACSSAEYGAALTPERLPITEDAPLLPLHPYGVSKVAQDLLAFQYWRAAGIRCIRARIFNTTGPGKSDDVVSDFAGRALAVAGDGGTLRVGNLEARRAILDVRDLVTALLLLARHGPPGEAFNISAPTATRIGDLIPILERLVGTRLAPMVDPSLLRPVDEPVVVGDTARLRAATGWAPRIPLETTLQAVLDHLRSL